MKSVKELFSLEGKVVLITGGAGYLGSAMCESLAELGAKLIIASRSEDKCVAFAKEIAERFNTEAMGIAIDITDMASIEKVMEAGEKKFGKIDVLINNAWSGNKNTFDSISVEDWNYDINVCLTGVFYTSKVATKYLSKTEGVIVNIASMYGHVAPDYRMYDGEKYANPPSYGAAKAGVIQLTKYMASFLSPKKIRVNAISPGPYPFPETQTNREFMAELEKRNTMGRIGQPEDLKGVIALLCSDASNYINGQNFCVDGGWSVW